MTAHPASVAPELHAALSAAASAGLPLWRCSSTAQPLLISRFGAGLTNALFLLDAGKAAGSPSLRYVLARVVNEAAPGIDRERERCIIQHLSSCALGPQVYATLRMDFQGSSFLLRLEEFIPNARTLSAEDFFLQGQLTRLSLPIAAVLRQFPEQKPAGAAGRGLGPALCLGGRAAAAAGRPSGAGARGCAARELAGGTGAGAGAGSALSALCATPSAH
jgi:hypothetical protein